MLHSYHVTADISIHNLISNCKAFSKKIVFFQKQAVGTLWDNFPLCNKRLWKYFCTSQAFYCPLIPGKGSFFYVFILFFCKDIRIIKKCHLCNIISYDLRRISFSLCFVSKLCSCHSRNCHSF